VLRKEHRLGAIENRELFFFFIVFRKLHNEESYDLYSENIGNILVVSRNILIEKGLWQAWERISMHTYCAEKRPFGRPRSVWEDNVEINLKEIGWGSLSWVRLAQDREKCSDVLNTITNLCVS
jgi:hypothetical protein